MPNVLSDGVKLDIQNNVNLKKIQEIASRASCNILVGFPSGEMHVPTLHKKKGENYKTFAGKSIASLEPIENAELAKMLSFGTSSIPARPFLKEGIESEKKKLQEELKKESKKVVEGQNPNWDKIGTMAVGAVQEFVRGEHYKATVPNSQKTIDYKGSDKPLIDGANLVQSIHFVVRRGM